MMLMSKNDSKRSPNCLNNQLNYVNLEIDNKDKFALIKKEVDDISLLVNRFNKNVNNVISKSIKKINQTFYYYEKTGKMINLFVKAFGIISDDKFSLQKKTVKGSGAVGFTTIRSITIKNVDKRTSMD